MKRKKKDGFLYLPTANNRISFKSQKHVKSSLKKYIFWIDLFRVLSPRSNETAIKRHFHTHERQYLNSFVGTIAVGLVRPNRFALCRWFIARRLFGPLTMMPQLLYSRWYKSDGVAITPPNNGEPSETTGCDSDWRYRTSCLPGPSPIVSCLLIFLAIVIIRSITGWFACSSYNSCCVVVLYSSVYVCIGALMMHALILARKALIKLIVPSSSNGADGEFKTTSVNMKDSRQQLSQLTIFLDALTRFHLHFLISLARCGLRKHDGSYIDNHKRILLGVSLFKRKNKIEEDLTEFWSYLFLFSPSVGAHHQKTQVRFDAGRLLFFQVKFSNVHPSEMK